MAVPLALLFCLLVNFRFKETNRIKREAEKKKKKKRKKRKKKYEEEIIKHEKKKKKYISVIPFFCEQILDTENFFQKKIVKISIEAAF